VRNVLLRDNAACGGLPASFVVETDLFGGAWAGWGVFAALAQR